MKTSRVILYLLLCLLWTSSQAQVSPVPSLPVSVPEEAWHPLLTQEDAALRAQLERELMRPRQWSRLIAADHMAVGIVDLTDPAAPRFASVNGDVMMYAASLPKIAILLGVVEGFEEGTIAETPEVINDLNEMIRVSSNQAATRMYNLAGFDRIESILTSPKYELFDTTHGGGLWVGKPYASTGTRHGDPLLNISHGATVNQVSRFYYLLATGRLINPARSRQMLDILSNPGINHKFVYSLRTTAPRARLFRKSGSWRNWHADSVLVWGPERRYIVVCLIESGDGEKIMRDIIPALERVLKPKKADSTAGAL